MLNSQDLKSKNFLLDPRTSKNKKVNLKLKNIFHQIKRLKNIFFQNSSSRGEMYI